MPYISAYISYVSLFLLVNLMGSSLLPEQEGNFVKKPIVCYSGREIMIELLQYLNLPLEPILDDSIIIP
ncbi:hypothetical protein N7452_009143 [Penicillium brevicompactum]|uniref:Uncharacterized protein n=1 Tax=Penicillium brevicompactum TaxID=5074 RepID=A0A9W9QAL6_PENBR|nr:hypothetical protein N7452_009143 [Penicillium brevicompactum]